MSGFPWSNVYRKSHFSIHLNGDMYRNLPFLNHLERPIRMTPAIILDTNILVPAALKPGSDLAMLVERVLLQWRPAAAGHGVLRGVPEDR